MTAPQNVEKVLQEKYARYLSLKQALDAYQLLYETNRQRLEEILLTISALESLKRKDIRDFDGFISLGSGIFMRVVGNLSKNVLMSIGANIAIEVSLDEAINKLRENEQKIREELSKIQSTITQLMETMHRIEEEIISLQKYLHK